MDTRIAERRAEVRRERMHRRRRRSVVAAVVLALVAAGAAVERSPLVALAAVEVHGVQRLDPEVVRDAADLPLGTSTLRLRLRAAEERVAALPGVRSVALRRVDPLTVRIDVVERLPVLAVETRREPFLVDADGIVVGDGELGRLPRVTTPLERVLEAGSDADDVPLLGNALAVYRGLPGPLRAEVERYEASGADDLDLLLAGGVRVRFGRGERVPEKARVLGALLEEVTEGTVVDVRAPSNPVVVPPQATSPLP